MCGIRSAAIKSVTQIQGDFWQLRSIMILCIWYLRLIRVTKPNRTYALLTTVAINDVKLKRFEIIDFVGRNPCWQEAINRWQWFNRRILTHFSLVHSELKMRQRGLARLGAQFFKKIFGIPSGPPRLFESQFNKWANILASGITNGAIEREDWLISEFPL